MFTGAFTALVTPFRDGAVDEPALVEAVDRQLDAGIDGLVPCGTTGETPTLTLAEQSRVIRLVAERAGGRVPVIAGAGSNSTARAIEQSAMAEEAGADALLHVTPYYNKPPQRALVAHFTAVADAARRPVVLYNVPGRTGCDLLPETAAELARHERIVAIKEATGSVARAQAVRAACGPDFTILSGDDATAMALCAAGAHGVISVVSNVVPGPMAEMVRAVMAGRLADARAINERHLRLMDLLFVEPNPIPVKAAMSLVGVGTPEVRLPLLPLRGEPLAELRAELDRLGLLP